MTYANPDAVVSTEWLAEHLDDPMVRVLDGTFHLPGVPRDAEAEFAAVHIPGAQRFNIDAVCDPASPYPHMLPSPEQFAAVVGAMGIGNDTHVVVYDVYGARTSPRVWWTFRVFGHDKVSVVDGGLPKWRSEERPVTDAPSSHPARRFDARFRPELVRNLDQIQGNIASRAEQLLDARPTGRFKGVDPEPRKGLKSGHIPGSRNMTPDPLYGPDKTLLPADKLREAFARAGVDLGKPLATTCGSGVAACSLALGLYLIGRNDVSVYDGSWSEWGAQQDTPTETG